MALLVAANIALPTLYSVRPTRLKERGVLGALADAGGVHAVPAATVAWVVARGLDTPMAAAFLAATVCWALCAGLRGIIVHQVADREGDLKAGVRTFGGSLGIPRARRLVFGVFLPLEVIGLLTFVGLVLPVAPVAAVVVAAYAVAEAVKIRSGWLLPMFDAPGRSTERYVPLVNNEFYEVWLPLGLALQLCADEPRLALLLGPPLALFLPNLVRRTSWIAEAAGIQPLPVRPRLAWARRRLRRLLRPLPPVVVGATTWTVNGVNIFSGNLARALREGGVDAHILLTEEQSNLVHYPEARLPHTAGVAFERLPCAPYDGWGMHWGRMQRYLEEQAPCIYLPNSDWRHSCVIPRLSRDVVVVGVVHSDDPLHYDHVRRLGPYWNAVVAVSQTIADKVVAVNPSLAGRVHTIPIGVHIPLQLARRDTTHEVLRVVYHGILKQHQKRVLDLPAIVAAAVARGIPIALSIVGAGPDEAALRAAAAPLVASGHIRFLGLLSPDDTGALLESFDAYLLPSEFEGMPNALIEAMGRGCVPIVTDTKSGIPELIHDGDNGFLVPVGDTEAFAERLALLWNDPARRVAMSRRAFATVSGRRMRIEDMVEAYEQVFEQAVADNASGRFIRPLGLLSPPPERVDGVSLFPVPLPCEERGVGAFPSLDDAEDYLHQINQITVTGGSRPRRRGDASAAGLTVWVSAPIWTSNGVNQWSEDLVRGLRAAGVDARLLLTEENTSLINVDDPRLPRPRDIPVEELRLLGADGWGARWGALARLLEGSAPCIYLPNYDWRHAAVIPTLSRGVSVVGVFHDDNPLYLEQAGRLKDYWQAAVTMDRRVARGISRAVPSLATRMTVIPHGHVLAETLPPRLASSSSRTLVVLGRDGAAAGRLAAFVAALHETGPHHRIVLLEPSPALAAALGHARVEVQSGLAWAAWLNLCRTSDFVIAAGGDGDTWRQLVEMMGHGSIPVLLDPHETTRWLIRADDTALVVDGAGDGEAGRAIDQLRMLMASAEDRQAMSRRAHDAVKRGLPSQDDMIAAYLDLFAAVRHETASTSPSPWVGVLPPPESVAGVQLFPIARRHLSELGLFPTAEDETRFVAERDGVAVAPAAERSGGLERAS